MASTRSGWCWSNIIRLLRAFARPLSPGESGARRCLSPARHALERAGRTCDRHRLLTAAGDKTDADPVAPDPRRFHDAGSWCAVRAVHLFGGAADPEIAARGVDRSLRADMDEPSTRPCVGVSQTLTRARRIRRVHQPGMRFFPNGRAENPGHSRLASHRLT